MDEKQINKWLRHRFSMVGWVLLTYLVSMNVLVAVTMFAQSYSSLLSGNYDMDAIAGNGWGYVANIIVGFVILHAWKGRDYWKRELLVKEKSMTPGTFFAVLALTVGAQMVNSLWIELLEVVMNQFGKSVMPMLEAVSGASDTFSMFLYASLLAPIAEEVLFRGVILRSLRPYGKRFAVLCSALLFGLFHGNLLQTPYTFLIGLVLGWVTVEYSIFWAVMLHMFNNLVLADLFSRLLDLLPAAAADITSLAVMGGCALASVVLLIVCRRRIRAYRESEWMDRRCLKCFFTSGGIITMTVLMLLSMASMFFM